MRFYYVNDGRSSTHCATLAEAHRDAKDRRPHCDWRDITIDEVEVGLDKENVLRLLNSEGGTHQYLRQWGITRRGGLQQQEREEA